MKGVIPDCLGELVKSKLSILLFDCLKLFRSFYAIPMFFIPVCLKK